MPELNAQDVVEWVEELQGQRREIRSILRTHPPMPVDELKMYESRLQSLNMRLAYIKQASGDGEKYWELVIKTRREKDRNDGLRTLAEHDAIALHRAVNAACE